MAPFEFRLADVGEGIHEVEVLAWKVKPGDRVRAFDPLCEVESAKATVELTSPVAGRIAETRVAVGATARVGEVLVVLDTEAPADDRAAAEEPPAEEWFGIVGAPPRPALAAAPVSPGNAVRAAPLVRKLARDRGIRIEDVPGSGPEGRVRLADLDAYAARASAGSAAAGSQYQTFASASGTQASRASAETVAGHPPQSIPRPRSPVPPSPAEERVPLAGRRKRIAEHMTEAMRRAPQVTAMDLFDVTDLVAARERLRPAAEREGTRLTYLPFVVKAAVEALRAVPAANARLDDARAEIVLKRHYNIGIATAAPEGLIVPVVKGADALSVLEIAREIARLTDAARARQNAPEDLRDGTFTISSFGGLPGSPLFATPILNYPEVAILGIGRIEEQPRVVGGQVVPRQCLGVSFTFDHRVLDGADAGAFMAVLRRYLEQPLEFLLALR